VISKILKRTMSHGAVSSNLLDSVLHSRIKQALAITSPSERSQIAVLENIHKSQSPEVRVADFADFLIDYIATLSHELRESRNRIATLETRGSHPSDYERSLKLASAPDGELTHEVNNLIRQNQHLQRLHIQDRSLLVKQNDAIAALQRRARRPPANLQGELRQVSEDLRRLDHAITHLTL
jgi:hypothetical protein